MSLLVSANTTFVVLIDDFDRMPNVHRLFLHLKGRAWFLFGILFRHFLHVVVKHSLFNDYLNI